MSNELTFALCWTLTSINIIFTMYALDRVRKWVKEALSKTDPNNPKWRS